MAFSRSERASAGRWRRLAAAVAVALAASACGESADAHFRKANAYLDQQQYAEAIIEYSVALQSEPKRGDIRAKLADAYLAEGNGDAALVEAVRAADLLPADVAAQLRAGRLLLAVKRFEDAGTRARKAIAIDPGTVDAHILLGNALASMRAPDEAISSFEEALALNPHRGETYVDLGVVHAAEGRGAEAEAAFRKAVEVAPNSVSALMALANYLWAANRAHEAEDTLKHAVALEPDNVLANRALGLFYLSANRVAEAEPHFRTIARAADTTPAILALADYYVLAGRPDDARLVLKELAGRSSGAATAMTALAAIDASAGNAPAAVGQLQALLATYPTQVSARLLLAQLLDGQGKKDEARAEATRIVTEAPNARAAEGAYMLLGRLNTESDQLSAAVDAYEQVVRRNPRPMAADLALAEIHLSRGAADKANPYAQQALTIDPDGLRPRALMARVLIAQGDLAQAGQEIDVLRKKFPSSPVVYTLAGAQELAAVTLGRRGNSTSRARASYARALALDPGNVDATIGLVRIDLGTGHTADAIARVEKTLAAGTPTAEFLVVAARTFATAANYGRAEELLRRALALAPSRLDTYGVLGQLYVAQGKTADAIAQFRAIVRRNPTSVSGLTMLGLLLQTDGHTGEAETMYRQALDLDRHAPVASNNLAWLLVSANRNLDEALQLAQNAQQQMQDNAYVNDTLGWIYLKKNIPSPAVRLLELSVEKDGTDPVSHYHLGVAYAALGEKDKARAALTRALAMNAGFDGAGDARRVLASLGS